MLVRLPVLKIITGRLATKQIIPESYAKVTSNILAAKNLANTTEKIVFDDIIPLPSTLHKIVSNPKSPVGRFYQALRSHKKQLMKDLGISNEEYNRFAVLALKISKEESFYGLSKKYKLYEIIESSQLGTKFVSIIRNICRGKSDLSLGLTRFKIGNANDPEIKLLKKYGITLGNMSNIRESEYSAIATIIHIAKLNKGYNRYLSKIKLWSPDTTSETVKESLNNAQRILFDNKLRPIAIQAIRTAGLKGNVAKVLRHTNLTMKDLDDLRTYAKTVILSREAFIAAKWNGRVVMPIGSRADISCANLLKTAALKGYVANIDKTSTVRYTA